MFDVDLVGCSICGAVKTIVSDTRPVFKDNVHYTRRKRECVKCKAAYWTKEVIDHNPRPWGVARLNAN
jgi:transcriptional regulator NrdR family protein|tara:strand:- start:518 stop:721 length:204 start_codon:yes stop_codon:yes gene_type:complete